MVVPGACFSLATISKEGRIDSEGRPRYGWTRFLALSRRPVGASPTVNNAKLLLNPRGTVASSSGLAMTLLSRALAAPRQLSGLSLNDLTIVTATEDGRQDNGVFVRRSPSGRVMFHEASSMSAWAIARNRSRALWSGVKTFVAPTNHAPSANKRAAVSLARWSADNSSGR